MAGAMASTEPDGVMDKIRAYDRELALQKHGTALLQWDQETYMPSAAAEERAEQLGLFETLVHDRVASDELGDLLAQAGAGPDSPSGAETLSGLEQALVRHLYREHALARRVPRELVGRLARAASAGQVAWKAAREHDDFEAFTPSLEGLLALSIERAECLGYSEHRYDALLDQYEPYTRTAEVRRVFEELERELVPLAAEIAQAPQVDSAFLYGEYPESRQAEFATRVLEDIGWPADRGRLDCSAHPFTIGLGRDDVRITARYDRNFFNTGFFSILHEAGHGLYELGFEEQIRGSTLADGASLGIHESQSRFWENLVGRSRGFWRRYYPRVRELFPKTLEGVDEERFYCGVNEVKPSLIRVEADEVTYCLHIIMRFRLELALVENSLTVKDLPDAWHEESCRLLGIVPERDADGVLQDVHWAMGGFGYFPTYALGNLYAAQFTETFEREHGALESYLERGEFEPVLGWLQERLHRHGAAKPADELVNSVTGAPLTADAYMRYLRAKFRDIYLTA